MVTYFDNFPVEILHMIFEYLTNSDIIWSFYNLSSYLNSVLINYSWHTLNFQSITKYRFDFLCNYLNIERILSLTLSNDIETPGQIQLFFQRYQLRNFINLHYLTLLSITNEDIYPLTPDLPKLKCLKSFYTQCRTSQPLLIGSILNQLKSLENLSISYGDIFDHNVLSPLYNLRVLDSGTCNFLELRRLQMIVPLLIYLKINLQANHQLQLVTNSNIWTTSLERLDLTLNDKTTTITFNEIQQFLLYFQNLTYLTLNLRGLSTNLADGYCWETCSTIQRLRKFNFIIEFNDSPSHLNQILSRFSTPFWLHIKKWYVAITRQYIYTISCFNYQLFYSSLLPPLSTSSDNHWFYSKIKQIKIEKNSSMLSLHQFQNVERFEFLDGISLVSMKTLSQFNYLRHLIFDQAISNTILMHILECNPQIDRLTLSQNNFKEFYPLKTINYLYFNESMKFLHRTQIKELCRIFPSLKQLLIYLNSIRSMTYLLDNLYQLENGIFYFKESIKPISHEWFKENTRLNNYTYRNEANRLLLWISNTNIPTLCFKEKSSEPINAIQNQSSSSDKCSLQ